MSDEAKWYVVHTYSGYENKVASNLEKTVENHSLQNLILRFAYPPKRSQKLPQTARPRKWNARFFRVTSL